jgi:mRNA-binding protein PUF3
MDSQPISGPGIAIQTFGPMETTQVHLWMALPIQKRVMVRKNIALCPLSLTLIDATLGTASNSNGDTQYPRGKTGSGSLLSLSESDGWNYRSNFPWSTATNGNSSALSRQQEQALSSFHLRNGEKTTSAVDLHPSDHVLSPFLPIGQHGRFSAPDYSLQEPSRHSNSTPQQRNTNSYMLGNSYNHSHGEEKRWNVNSAGFRANDTSSSTQSSLRFLNPDKEFSSVAPGKLQHNNLPTQSRNNFDLLETQPRSSRASNPPDSYYNSTSHPFHRLSGSTNRSLSGRQDPALQFNGQEDQLLTKLHKIDLQAETIPQDFPRFQTQEPLQRTASKLDRSLEAGFSRPKHHSGSENLGLANQLPASSDGTADIGYQFLTDYRQTISFSERESSSPAASDYRRGLSSPFYSTNGGTPATGPESVRSASGNGLSNHASNGQIVTLDGESIGSRPFHLEEQYVLSNTSHSRLQYNQPYSFEGYSGSLRLNPLALPYPVPAYGGLTNAYQPRYPSREHDSSQIIRSTLLEEFRANHKTNKRYELKVS